MEFGSMRCACGRDYLVYELLPRSYRLYAYLCPDCMNGFLAHHFDIDLEKFNLGEIAAKRTNRLIFISGLRIDPRVFDFEIEGEGEAIVVADVDIALGELAVVNGEYHFAPYSERAEVRLKDLLGIVEEGELASKVALEWRKAK